MERPRELIPPGRHGLCHQVAVSLRHSQPRSVDGGGSTGYQLRLPPNAESCGTAGSEHGTCYTLAPEVGRYIKTIPKDLREVASHQRDWDARLPISLLPYKASNHDTTDFIPAILVLKRTPPALRPAIRGTPDKEPPTIELARDPVDWLHDIRNYAR